MDLTGIGHITIKFIGSDYTTFLHWCLVKSLSNLKELIHKMYQIPEAIQTVSKEDGIILTEETFMDLHKTRYTEDVTLNVKILDGSFDLNSIIERRKSTDFRLDTALVQIPNYGEKGKNRFLYIKADSSWKIQDVKNELEKRINYPASSMVIILENADIILDDGQLLSDICLLFDSVTYTLVGSKCPTIKYNPPQPFYCSLPNIIIHLPNLNRTLTERPYPLLRVGTFKVSEMKNWIEFVYKIPSTEQEINKKDSLVKIESLAQYTKTNATTHSQVELIVYSTSDEDLNLIYQEHNIRTLKPTHITSFHTDRRWVYHYKGEEGQCIKEFIEEHLGIPGDRQFLFYKGKKCCNTNFYFLWSNRFKKIPSFTFHLIAQFDDEEHDDLLKKVQ